MQFDIKDKVWRSDIAPSAYQHRVRYGIEGRIDFHHGEILRVPTESICRAHLFWIPKLDEPRVRPAGGANKDFSGGHRVILLELKNVLNLPSRRRCFCLRFKRRSEIVNQRRGVEQPGSSSGS